MHLELVLKACDLVREGRTAEEIVNTVNGLRAKVNTSFVPAAMARYDTAGYGFANLFEIKVMRNQLHGKVHELFIKLRRPIPQPARRRRASAE